MLSSTADPRTRAAQPEHAPAALAQLESSGYRAYDRKITGEMRQWIYKPYKQNGRAIAVCTAVAFIYDASKPRPDARQVQSIVAPYGANSLS